MELKAEKLDNDNFSEFGTILNPEKCGTPLIETEHISYYPDRLPLTFSGGTITTISLLTLKKRDMLMDLTEYHEHTEEIFGGFNLDVVFHVGPARKDPNFSEFKAFILPKFNWVRIKRGIWHLAPFIIDGEETLGWVLLPPFTYANDTVLAPISEPIKITI